MEGPTGAIEQLSQKSLRRDRHVHSEDCPTHGVEPAEVWMTVLAASDRGIQGEDACYTSFCELEVGLQSRHLCVRAVTHPYTQELVVDHL